jgi:DNA polymerase-1
MKIPDHVKLEMTMAEIMAQQEASGFRFDMAAAERVRAEISVEFDELCNQIRSRFAFFPGKVFTPKRNDNKSGYRAGAPMTKLVEFNPTSRQHIAWALTTHRYALFTKKTDSGKPQVDEAVLSEIAERALSNDDKRLHDECEMFIRVLTVQKWLGQLSEGTNSWFNTIEEDGCIHHSCQLATITSRNIHKSPNLGQVNSAPWARQRRSQW